MAQSDISPGSTSPASDTRDAARIREAIAKANKAWNNQQQQPDTPGGTVAPVAAAGALPDANATITYAQGTWRTLPVLSADHTLGLLLTSAQLGDQIQVTRTALDEFEYTINDAVGAPLLVMGAGIRTDALFEFTGGAGGWSLRWSSAGNGAVHAGSASLAAGGGTVTVAAPWITATTRITCSPNIPTTPGAGNLTTYYGEVIGSRVIGTSFTLNAAIDAGTINVLDLSTLQWHAIDVQT